MLIKRIISCLKKLARKIKTYLPNTMFHDQYYSNLDLGITKFAFIKCATAVCLVSAILAFACIYRLLMLLFFTNKCFSCYGWEWWVALLLAKITSFFVIIDWNQNRIDKKERRLAEKLLYHQQQLGGGQQRLSVSKD